MDPLAHTLVGACLGEAGLKRTTRFGMATLLLSANLPDVDAFVRFAGADVMYAFRRGWTHGVLGVAVLPFVLAAGVLVVGRMRPRSDDVALSPRRIVALSYLGTLTHPALDWLNNYGVRLLMPFDGTWFYGDALFIVDPWMWLSMAAAVVLGSSSTRLGIGAWTVLGLATTGLVIMAPLVPPLAKLLWGVVVAAIVVARCHPLAVRHAPVVACGCLAALVVYVAAMIYGSALARDRAGAWFEQRGFAVDRIIAGPLPVNPFVRDIIAVTHDGYRFAKVDFLATDAATESHPPIPFGDGPEARAARTSPDIQGFLVWLRLPAYTVRRTAEGVSVRIDDVRYSRQGATIGTVTVFLDDDLVPTRAVLRDEER